MMIITPCLQLKYRHAEFIDNKWHLKEINETVINNSLITKKYTKRLY